MLEPSLHNDLVEMIGGNFKTDEINEIGKLIFECYDSHRISGIRSIVSLSSRRSAGVLVEHCQCNGKIRELIKLVAELDGGILLGRPKKVEGLEEFLSRLARTGIIYDFGSRKLIPFNGELSELANWGSLKDGKFYDITVISLDIVNNSILVKKYGIRRMEKLYYKLWAFLKQKLAVYDGRLWSWAGDGGIIAFTFKNHLTRAVCCALEIQSTLPVFNMAQNTLTREHIELRLGMDKGRVRFFSDTGKIISDVINYAAHLEKWGTAPGMITISRKVHESLDPKLQAIFKPIGVFEDREYFSTLRRIDSLTGAGQFQEEDDEEAAQQRVRLA